MNCREQVWANPDLYLFADEQLIEKSEGARFRICQMKKSDANPVMVPEQVWEGGDGTNRRPNQQDSLTGSILYDPEEKDFHFWYGSHNRLIRNAHARGTTIKPAGSRVCYATSSDGFNWEKPYLRRVCYNGSLENNMIDLAREPVMSDHLSGVTLNYTDSIEGKFIGTIFSRYDDPVYPQGITFATSNNGIDWQHHYPPVMPLDGDAHCLMWDPNLKCYLCTTRSFVQPHLIRRLQKHHDTARNMRVKRHVALAKSRDMIHWTPMLTVLDADSQDPTNAQLYYMYIIPYGNVYIGMVQMFYMQEKLMTYGPLDMQVTVSRDLMNWQRIGDRTPIIPRGPEDSWDQSHISICTSPPHPDGNELRFWYGGKDTEHWQAGNAGLGTATLRRDGFACWETVGEGCITTVPMEIDWATYFFINVEAPAGGVRVEMLDARTMEPIEGVSKEDCLPITGDHLDAPVVYTERRGTFIRHTGLIRLRFYLKNARIYSFNAMNVKIADPYKLDERLWL